MATSPIYNWPEPDNTDLVKNGALAMRTLGDAIDTTMATMTPKSIVDAKGDLIAASAADTPARLAVGADYGFLQALASASTGLQWNSGAWTSYTPTVTPSSGSITSYSLTLAKYQRIGKTCIVKFAFTLTNAGTGSGLAIDLPFTSTADGVEMGVGSGREYQTTGNMLQIRVDNSSPTKANIAIYNNTQPCVTGYRHSGTIVYEVA